MQRQDVLRRLHGLDLRKSKVSGAEDVLPKKKVTRKAAKSIFPYGDAYNDNVKAFYRWVE